MTTTFPTVADQTDYVLDKRIGQPYSVLSSVLPYKLRMLSRYNLDKLDAERLSEGNPEIATISDIVPVTTQPTSASVIEIVSSSSADTTQSVLVKGIVGGQEDYEQVSLNGTTSVFTTRSFSSITSITKSGNTTGRVTFSIGATTLLIMGALERTAHLRVMTLYPIPQAVITITVRHFGKAPYMTNAYESTMIPEDWDYVVDQWAFILALQSKGQEQSTEFSNQVLVGTKMLSEDMSVEERDSSDDPILLDDAGNFPGHRGGAWLPSGHGYMDY